MYKYYYFYPVLWHVNETDLKKLIQIKTIRSLTKQTQLIKHNMFFFYYLLNIP